MKGHQGKGSARRPLVRVRVIAGSARRRLVEVPERPGLRPTPDRVRETLFNWLQADIAGSHCLDLFAGTGALSLESLSRGAASVLAVERDAALAGALRTNAADLALAPLRVVERDAWAWLQAAARAPLATAPAAYDIVFLDPPFAAGAVARALDALLVTNLIAPHGLVYMEQAMGEDAPALPPEARMLHCAKAGQVGYYLAAMGRLGQD